MELKTDIHFYTNAIQRINKNIQHVRKANHYASSEKDDLLGIYKELRGRYRQKRMSLLKNNNT